MRTKEKLTLINGNGKKYKVNLPFLYYLTDNINDIALNHIEENTGLKFIKVSNGLYTAKPTTSKQIVKLFLTYNFKTQYHDNATNSNVLFLKSDYHAGFKVDSICYDCVKENGLSTHGLTKKERLSC